MSEVPYGSVVGNEVLVQGNSAITLHNRGHYGTPEGQKLRLTSFEALHLYELGRLTIDKDKESLNEEQLLRYFSDVEENFVLRYYVYKDLRNRGYVVNIGSGSSFFFRLYDRGKIPKKDAASYYVTPLQEGNHINLSELNELIQTAHKSGKTLVFGMVDASGEVSYLQVSQLSPADISTNKNFSNFDDWSWDDEIEKFNQEQFV